MNPFRSLGRSIDRIAVELAPTWGRDRLQARARAKQLELGMQAVERIESGLARRRYDAAKVSARTHGWNPVNTSANAETFRDLRMLQARSRELVRNNPWANVGKRRVASNMVGDGVRATVEHKPKGGTPSETAAEEAQGYWDEWCEDVDCDADGRSNFYGQQYLIAASAFEAGEILARFRPRRLSDDLVVPLQVQLLEIDHLDTNRDLMARPGDGQNRVQQGIEVNAIGQRVAYWLWPEHPGDPAAMRSRASVPVPARFIAHCYRVERPGQLRGIPWVAPVAIQMHDLGDWMDASLVRSRIAALLAGFITTEAQEDPAASLAGVTSASGKQLDEWEPGMLARLGAGESITFSNPPGVEGMDEFPRLSLRAIAVGCGIPYEVLTGDLTQVNFASGRMGWLEFQRELEAWRRDVLVMQFCRMAFENWRDQAEIAGLIQPGMIASWDPPARGMVDPSVDLEVARGMIRAGLSTPSAEARARGWRPTKLWKEQAKDWKQIDALELSFDSDGRRPLTGPVAPPPQGDPAGKGRPPSSGR